MALEKNCLLYYLALILPLLGQLVLVFQFYSTGQIGYSLLTAAIFLMFSGMTILMYGKKS